MQPRALLSPIFALVAMTTLITLLMGLSRNIAVMIGRASTVYYADYKPETAPADWIERWVFVATRAVHAVIYIGVNYVPARFTHWLRCSLPCSARALLQASPRLAVGASRR